MHKLLPFLPFTRRRTGVCGLGQSPYQTTTNYGRVCHVISVAGWITWPSSVATAVSLLWGDLCCFPPSADTWRGVRVPQNQKRKLNRFSVTEKTGISHFCVCEEHTTEQRQKNPNSRLSLVSRVVFLLYVCISLYRAKHTFSDVSAIFKSGLVSRVVFPRRRLCSWGKVNALLNGGFNVRTPG